MSTPEQMSDKLDPQTAFQLEKLRLEVADLRWKVRWVSKVGQIISIVSALVAVAAFLVSLYQFNAQQRLNAKRETAAYRREFRKPVWNKQLELLFQISEAAAMVAAAAPGDQSRKQAEAKFWQLFYGPSVFVEGIIEEDEEDEEATDVKAPPAGKGIEDRIRDVDVREAVVTFARCLQGISDECDDSHSPEEKTIQLQKLSLELTSKCRDSVASTWKLRFKAPTPEIAPATEVVLP